MRIHETRDIDWSTLSTSKCTFINHNAIVSSPHPSWEPRPRFRVKIKKPELLLRKSYRKSVVRENRGRIWKEPGLAEWWHVRDNIGASRRASANPRHWTLAEIWWGVLCLSTNRKTLTRSLSRRVACGLNRRDVLLAQMTTVTREWHSLSVDAEL